jgi:hypothetical protein
MAQSTTAWQCIGCGRLDSDATCMGVCQDRKVVLVSAADYEQARREIDELRLFIRQLANVEPRGGSWERSYRALQERAHRLLGRIEDPTVKAAA